MADVDVNNDPVPGPLFSYLPLFLKVLIAQQLPVSSKEWQRTMYPPPNTRSISMLSWLTGIQGTMFALLALLSAGLLFLQGLHLTRPASIQGEYMVSKDAKVLNWQLHSLFVQPFCLDEDGYSCLLFP